MRISPKSWFSRRKKSKRELALGAFLDCPICGIEIGQWMSDTRLHLLERMTAMCPAGHRFEFSDRKWILGTDKFRVIS